MTKHIMVIIVAFVLIFVPALTIAKPQNGGPDKNQGKAHSPTPNASAYEHANEKAKFLRENQDTENNQDLVTPKVEDEDKSNDKGDDQGSEKDKGKKKKGSKSTEKSKGSPDKNKDKSLPVKDKGKEDKPETEEVKY